MSPAVEFHDEARLEARDFYAARNPAAAEAFTAEIERAIDAIGDTPEVWSPYLHGTRRYLLRRFPYSVIDRRAGDRLEVVAVAHQRRRPGYWRGR